MITSYRNKGLEAFATTGSTRRLANQNTARITRILAILQAATRAEECNIPGYRWHPLGRMQPGRYAMEVNGNYRITFGWEGSGAIDVDLEDYH